MDIEGASVAETICNFCDGTGHWEYENQTLFCPICHRQEAEYQALARNPLPSWHSSAWPIQIEAKYYGPRFQVEPWLLVIHSGSMSDNVAKYFANPGDGRKVSAHLAWDREHRGFAQCVPLSHAAWHVGGSRFRGQGKLNFCSIGIELPGPWEKARDAELDLLREAVEIIIQILPITTAVRHSDIDPRKKDPGPGFDWACLRGLTPPLDLPFDSV